ncbi:MAG: imidazole glycerol phosphate synthase subunit HisH [Gemmataceae bacterium]
MSAIVIVDYGMANLRSVQKALEHVGHSARISANPDEIAGAERLILPGVGAFRDAIARLNEAGLAEPIRNHVRGGKPFLGICLGLQLLFSRSYEDGEYEGLNLLEGEVVRFRPSPGLKIPHMGWNTLTLHQPVPMLTNLPGPPCFYFVHSYYPVPRDPDVIAATADYPTPFCAAIAHRNVFATQFHPEKSQQVGLHLLKRFAEWPGT